jgi:hypothetical protein
LSRWQALGRRGHVGYTIRLMAKPPPMSLNRARVAALALALIASGLCWAATVGGHVFARPLSTGVLPSLLWLIGILGVLAAATVLRWPHGSAELLVLLGGLTIIIGIMAAVGWPGPFAGIWEWVVALLSGCFFGGAALVGFFEPRLGGLD